MIQREGGRSVPVALGGLLTRGTAAAMSAAVLRLRCRAQPLFFFFLIRRNAYAPPIPNNAARLSAMGTAAGSLGLGGKADVLCAIAPTATNASTAVIIAFFIFFSPCFLGYGRRGVSPPPVPLLFLFYFTTLITSSPAFTSNTPSTDTGMTVSTSAATVLLTIAPFTV